MANDPERLIIVDADKIHGDLLNHFSSGSSVLYRAQFLWDAREQDGNVALPDDATEKDEAIVLPE
jgi:hypothetical protein